MPCLCADYITDDQPHFLRTTCQLAETLRHTIFVDQVRLLHSHLATAVTHENGS